MSVLGYGPGWRARLAKNPPSSRTGPIRADGSRGAMLTWRARSGRSTFETPLERAYSVQSVRITCRTRAKTLRLVSMGIRAGGGWAPGLRAAHALLVTIDDHGELNALRHRGSGGHGRELLRNRQAEHVCISREVRRIFPAHSSAQAHVSGRG